MHNRELMITAALPGSGDWGKPARRSGRRAGRHRRRNVAAGAVGAGES
ncbi:hypothetical protein LNP17_24590 [Klebsiella variicola subsp. variicola]|nr:hypothetical protein [Klebsiella variicola subsp. variicola]